jgi:hypothetical protein
VNPGIRSNVVELRTAKNPDNIANAKEVNPSRKIKIGFIQEIEDNR